MEVEESNNEDSVKISFRGEMFGDSGNLLCRSGDLSTQSGARDSLKTGRC